MFTREAIIEIQQGASITQAAQAVQEAFDAKLPFVALPAAFTRYDIENMLAHRSRARGLMQTGVLADFVAYTRAHASEGACIFVDKAAMRATAILNLGTPQQPGHGDHRACFAPDADAAWLGWQKVADGAAKSQKTIAEFIEDFRVHITCEDECGDELGTALAASAIRHLTVEAVRKNESVQQQNSSARSAFESVTAQSKLTLPVRIEFYCTPYLDMQERNASARLSILTTDNPPRLILRPIHAEQLQQDMARELAEKINKAFEGADIPILQGQWAGEME